jgi:putative ABC transport system ATP-binding protein
VQDCIKTPDCHLSEPERRIGTYAKGKNSGRWGLPGPIWHGANPNRNSARSLATVGLWYQLTNDRKPESNKNWGAFTQNAPCAFLRIGIRISYKIDHCSSCLRTDLTKNGTGKRTVLIGLICINPQVLISPKLLTLGVISIMVQKAETVFRTKGLAKVYRTGAFEVHALRGVDFEAASGEFLVILGPSGSGKSTFLNIVGGLDTATAGKAWFKDIELTALDARGLTAFRREHVGFVFQFYNLVPSLTARENVQLVTEIAHNPMSADDALALVGLTDRRDHFPAQLSGGEQQRVAIARAIAKNPAVLLCDEPTGALDSATGVQVLEVLTQVNKTVGATTLIITHNAATQAIADRVLRFADGKIVEETVNSHKKKPAEISW